MFDDAGAFGWICGRLAIDALTLQKALDERHAYRRVFIAKRGPKDRRKGRKRVLHVPPETLKWVQRRIHEVLLRPFKWPSPVHGFVSRRSHLTAAARHRGQSALLTIDFKTAFDHLKHFHVYRVFVTRLHLDPRVAYWLAELATHRTRLPQGAPSSPLIFNLVALDLDEWLSGFAKERLYLYALQRRGGYREPAVNPVWRAQGNYWCVPSFRVPHRAREGSLSGNPMGRTRADKCSGAAAGPGALEAQSD